LKPKTKHKVNDILRYPQRQGARGEAQTHQLISQRLQKRHQQENSQASRYPEEREIANVLGGFKPATQKQDSRDNKDHASPRKDNRQKSHAYEDLLFHLNFRIRANELPDRQADFDSA